MPVHHEGQGRKPGHGTSHSRETHLRRGTRHSYEFGGNIKLIDCAWFAQGGFISHVVVLASQIGGDEYTPRVYKVLSPIDGCKVFYLKGNTLLQVFPNKVNSVYENKV